MANEPPFRGSAVDPSDRQSGFDSEARGAETPGNMPRTPECPFCDGHETEIMNAFGSHASVSSYWCRACRSPFEIMKWRG